MSESQSKRLRRAERVAKIELSRSGLGQRVRAINAWLKRPLSHVALRSRLKVHFASLQREQVIEAVRALLIDDGFDLDGIGIEVGANPVTRGLILKVDASHEAVRAAIATAERNLSQGNN